MHAQNWNSTKKLRRGIEILCTLEGSTLFYKILAQGSFNYPDLHNNLSLNLCRGLKCERQPPQYKHKQQTSIDSLSYGFEPELEICIIFPQMCKVSQYLFVFTVTLISTGNVCRYLSLFSIYQNERINGRTVLYK